MTSRDFCYWIQGFFELACELPPPDVDSTVLLNARQVDLIRRHLQMVFTHEIDPAAGPPEHQEKLNAIHDGPHRPVDPGPEPGVPAIAPTHIGGPDGPGGVKFRC